MKFKQLIAAVALTAGIFSTNASADTVKFTDGFGTTNGGEFNADSQSNVWLGTFITFCLEKNESLSFGQAYYYALSTSAVNGGLSGGNPDPLSQGSAYLYSNLRNNTLAAGNGSGSYYDLATRTANADLFQNAIWELEGEGTGAVTVGNNWYFAQAMANGGTAHATNLLGVQVMNIYLLDSNNQAIHMQSQLYLVSDSGMSVALLGLGLLSLALVRRKL